ncbi:hypothetical protein HAX54_027309 [Datura stramonium]|uniref:Uncharacterized protein n=1 Tax=Datura stramonium TaxID=4076 RepID=A0ABS8S8M5_DATST|nr:hypothetical protein [Datura stramonium]
MHQRFTEINQSSAALPSFLSICAQFITSQLVDLRRFANWIGDLPVNRCLGAKDSGILCFIGDPPMVHSYASAFHPRVRQSLTPSPSLLFSLILKWRFALLHRRLSNSVQFRSVFGSSACNREQFRSFGI